MTSTIWFCWMSANSRSTGGASALVCSSYTVMPLTVIWDRIPLPVAFQLTV